VTKIQGFNVPQLLGHDDEIWIIDMSIVTRPFVLDFAGAYLDVPPQFPTEAVWDALPCHFQPNWYRQF
jgi:hypothetical protein